jgi:hypothetical protein
MRFRDVVQLISVTETKDALGRPQQTETTGAQIPCMEDAIGVIENYQAQAAGFSPNVKLKVRAGEYSGQAAMQYDDQRYRIIRTSKAEKGFLVLVGEAVGRG